MSVASSIPQRRTDRAKFEPAEREVLEVTCEPIYYHSLIHFRVQNSCDAFSVIINALIYILGPAMPLPLKIVAELIK